MSGPGFKKMMTLDEARNLNRVDSVNQGEPTANVPKISKILFERRETSFNSLAALPSNVEAIEAALMFSAGLNPFVALVGPSGWGKSHLISAVASRLAHDRSVTPERYSVGDYLANPLKADTGGPLLLDDVQDVLSKSRMKMALRLNLERRVRCGKATILAFTSPKASRALRSFLPMPREWTIATMGAAEPAERVLLLHQMSATEGLVLSPRLSKVIADQMSGNGRTLAGALKRLRLSGTNWLDPSATLRAFGLLDPFFADNGIWDLKHKILRVAATHRDQFSTVSSTDLALYTMLHEAGLSEVSVARAAEIEPADAYLRASSFKLHLTESETARAYVRQFIDLVVESLAKD